MYLAGRYIFSCIFQNDVPTIYKQRDEDERKQAPTGAKLSVHLATIFESYFSIHNPHRRR